MTENLRTPFYDAHVAGGAQMVPFAGWDMPLSYARGIVHEHLTTRKDAGLFDVSHMGRFLIGGPEALPFLQQVLTNNAAGLDARDQGAQYTLLATETGGAVDDAYLYRFMEDAYLLVVNAANRQKDWNHLQGCASSFPHVHMDDRTQNLAMVALQGPRSRDILQTLRKEGALPEPRRNTVSRMVLGTVPVLAARTGYTGEPLCFELFVDAERGPALWELLAARGACPVGLGARDTLRLEAGLPLYGHELGLDPDGKEIPIMACAIARGAVSFSPLKGDFAGRAALARQLEAYKAILNRDNRLIHVLPRQVLPVALMGRGVARPGAKVFQQGEPVGLVTSGTAVPYWIMEGEGLGALPSEQHTLRSIGLAYLDSRVRREEPIEVEIRGKRVEARIVTHHLRSDAPPYARPILADRAMSSPRRPDAAGPARAGRLVQKALENTRWRQEACINLIPSEMTLSPLVRLTSVLDPAFRYAEHRKVKAFYDADIFYYQGTDFIQEVEGLLQEELKAFLGCREVETRVISGQMANTIVFGALLDHLNRGNPRQEPHRIPLVMHHHLGKGGHLSAQPMGALRDFIARDPRTDRPAVVPFPVLAHDPFQMDVEGACRLLQERQPRLVVLGKSMVLYPEPVREIRTCLIENGLDTVLLYDAAHVLGLMGPHFQEPFAEGADLVTGSTHKTFFGTQRGVVGGRYQEGDPDYPLWEAIMRRAFPGSVSNHHLGTLLGLLFAAYEMNHFKDAYQVKVLANAKAFAHALASLGLEVAGDPERGFTETHQVILRVGYGQGPEMARRLEASHILCNYQATADEEGFTASGSLRLGVAEMTRFGMEARDFARIAELMKAVIKGNSNVRSEVKDLRTRFTRIGFCFEGPEWEDLMQSLHRLI